MKASGANPAASQPSWKDGLAGSASRTRYQPKLPVRIGPSTTCTTAPDGSRAATPHCVPGRSRSLTVVRVAAMAPAWKIGTLAWSGVGSGVADGEGVGLVVGVRVGADEADGSAGDADSEGPARQSVSMPAVRKRPIAASHRVDCRVT